MKNFLKFTPNTHESNFKIEEPNLSFFKKYSRNESFSSSLKENLKVIEYFFHFPTSDDFKIRSFEININNNKFDSAICFYDGIADSQLIDKCILKPLLKPKNVETNSIIKKNIENSLKDIILGSMLNECQITLSDNFDTIINAINHGECLIMIDSLNTAIICDVKKIPSRSVDKSENEMTIKGPAEAFIETLRTNTALIRKFVKDEDLIFETINIGLKSKTKCTIAYISDITNESIIKEVKKRISSIKTDYIIDTGELEQYIEDKTYLIDPLILSTERPDKVASNLIEGRVAIMLEGSPNVLIVPAVFSDFTHPAEDTYVRHPYAILLRIFRIPSIFLSIFLPGIYIAIATFHQEMIPTDLLFAIAGTREKVPFPMLIELLIMETSFEIIREASIRTPAPVGPTLGIVGTLILRSSNS